LPIFNFRLRIACCRNANSKSQLAIGNVTWSPCDPCAYGSDGRTS